MKSKPVKIIQLGTGHPHAAAKMAAMRDMPNRFEVLGYMEDIPSTRGKYGSLPEYEGLKRFTFEEVYEQPDLEAVAVETDIKDIIPAANISAERGLHVHIDNPPGQKLFLFRKLLRTCREKNLVFQQSYIYRYNPAVRFMTEVVRKGWLGKLFEIRGVMNRSGGDNPDYRKWLSQFRGGAMFIYGGYLIDFILYLLGEPENTTSFLTQTRFDNVKDNCLSVLEYHGAIASVCVSVEEVHGAKYRRIIVCGTNGTLELSPIEPQWNPYSDQRLSVRMTLKDGNEEYESGTHIVDCGTLPGRYELQFTEFYRMIREGVSNPFPYEHEYRLHRTLLRTCGFSEDELT